MIAECATDLLARVQAVAALAGRASLSIGGRSADPGLLKAPLPIAWVVYSGDQADEAPYGSSGQGGPGMVPASQVMLTNWRVIVYVNYASDADLIANQYPLLEAVVEAVKTTVTDPAGGLEAPSGHRWRYAGQKAAVLPNDRMAYEQHYTLDIVL